MMDETLSERQIVTAISWWGAQLRKPAVFDNGARDLAGLFAGSMAGQIRAEVPITNIQVGTFVHALAGILQAGGIEQRRVMGILRTDYHPDAFLDAALETAGIPDAGGCILPWKTIMWFMDGGVKVSAGYGARQQWISQPTRVQVGRREPEGEYIYKPATTYWRRRATRFRVHSQRDGVLERLLSHGLRCRSCNLPEYAWQHNGRRSGSPEHDDQLHAFADPTPTVKWRVVKTALRAIRDGKEEQLFAQSVRI